MGEFSITHWLVILAILLIFFGPSKLPQLGKSMGEAIRGFKKGLNQDDPANNNQAQRDSLSAPDKQAEVEKNKEKSRT